MLIQFIEFLPLICGLHIHAVCPAEFCSVPYPSIEISIPSSLTIAMHPSVGVCACMHALLYLPCVVCACGCMCMRIFYIVRTHLYVCIVLCVRVHVHLLYFHCELCVCVCTFCIMHMYLLCLHYVHTCMRTYLDRCQKKRKKEKKESKNPYFNSLDNEGAQFYQFRRPSSIQSTRWQMHRTVLSISEAKFYTEY